MPKNIKTVVDTNVIISAVIGTSPTSRQLFNAFVTNRFTPVVADTLLNEIHAAIRKPKLKKYFTTDNIKKFNRLMKIDALLVKPFHKTKICRDAKDNFILDIALAGKADVIVTGDADLLTLNPFKNIQILTPKDFISFLK